MSNIEYRLKYKDPQTGEVKQLSGGGDLESLKQEILEAENPVGCLRFQTISTNPSEYLGFGTWQLWGSGRVPVGVDTSDTDFNTIEKTGGEKAHTLTIEEMPSHYHQIAISGGDDAGVMDKIALDGYGSAKWYSNTRNTGNTQSHNNLQPYITCYIYKRIK